MPRKNAEALALRLLGAESAAPAQVRALPHFLSAAPWDDPPSLAQHQHLVAASLGEPAGVLIVAGRDVAKHGTPAGGVARQYCGAPGKRDNCQAGGYLAYASSRGATLLDRRLYVPAAWFDDARAARRDTCGWPTDRAFRTRAQLAAALGETVQTRGGLPARWLTADAACGADPAFLDRVAAQGLWYLAAVPRTTPVWPRVDPATGARRTPPAAGCRRRRRPAKGRYPAAHNSTPRARPKTRSLRWPQRYPRGPGSPTAFWKGVKGRWSRNWPRYALSPGGSGCLGRPSGWCYAGRSGSRARTPRCSTI